MLYILIPLCFLMFGSSFGMELTTPLKESHFAIDLKKELSHNPENIKAYLEKLQLLATSLHHQDKLYQLAKARAQSENTARIIELRRNFGSVLPPVENKLSNPATGRLVEGEVWGRLFKFDFDNKFPDDTSYIRSPEAYVTALRHADLLCKAYITNQDLEIIKQFVSHPNNEIKALGGLLHDNKAMDDATKQDDKAVDALNAFIIQGLRRFCDRPYDARLGDSEVPYIKSLVLHINDNLAQCPSWANVTFIRNFSQASLNYLAHLIKKKSEGKHTDIYDEHDNQETRNRSKLISRYAKQRLQQQALYAKISRELYDVIREQRPKTKDPVALFKFRNILHTDDRLPEQLNTNYITEPIIEEFDYINSKAEIVIQGPTGFEVPTPKKSVKKSQPGNKKTKSPKPVPIAHSTTSVQINQPSESSDLVEVNEAEHYFRLLYPSGSSYIELLLYKLNMPPITVPDFKLHERVKSWIINPQKALTDQGYLSEGHENYTDIKWHPNVILRHGFTELADKYLPRVGIATPYKKYANNPHIKTLSILGEIRILNIQKQQLLRDLVAFRYAIDAKDPKNPVCFHRCATKQVPLELLDDIAKKKWEIDYDQDFPALT